MGKPTGFIEYTRSVEMVRPPLERVADWREFHPHSDESELRNQSAMLKRQLEGTTSRVSSDDLNQAEVLSQAYSFLMI